MATLERVPKRPEQEGAKGMSSVLGDGGEP